jgi:hypothetical protein
VDPCLQNIRRQYLDDFENQALVAPALRQRQPWFRKIKVISELEKVECEDQNQTLKCTSDWTNRGMGDPKLKWEGGTNGSYMCTELAGHDREFSLQHSSDTIAVGK